MSCLKVCQRWLSKSLILAYEGCILDFFEDRHRLEHGGSDLVNANFESDRAYCVRRDSKGNQGIQTASMGTFHVRVMCGSSIRCCLFVYVRVVSG